MHHRIAIAVSSIVLLGSGVAAPAQTAKDLVGTWMITSSVNVQADGKRTETLNKGILVFDSNGRFVILALRPGLPKFASNNRNTGTPEENKAVVQGSVGLYGTYSMNGKEVSLKVEASTFPGFDATEQKRTDVSLAGDELKWVIPAASGSTGARTEQAFKRAK